MPRPAQRYADALPDLKAAGRFNPVTLPNAKTIQRRLQKLDTLDQANAEFEQALRGIESALQSRLETQGIAAANVRTIMSAWRKGASLDLQLKVRQTDTRLFAAARGMLQTLDRAPGQWQVDPGGELRFDSEALTTTYNQYFDQMQRATQEQLAAQRKAAIRANAAGR